MGRLLAALTLCGGIIFLAAWFVTEDAPMPRPRPEIIQPRETPARVISITPTRPVPVGFDSLFGPEYRNDGTFRNLCLDRYLVPERIILTNRCPLMTMQNTYGGGK